MEDDLLVIKNMQLIFDSMRIFKLTRMAECKLSVVYEIYDAITRIYCSVSKTRKTRRSKFWIYSSISTS